MCGVVGFAGAPDEAQLVAMTRAVAHRGPDGEGFFTDAHVSLGHRRLVIIDERGGAQPMYSADRRYVIAYNGEIYNYRELRAELEQAGRRFTTDSDTEVVLVGFQQWGAGVLDRLLGMFAFAVYDTVSHDLLLARDRLGIKPLYYVEAPRLAFASEIKALLAVDGVRRAVDTEVLARFLKFRVHDSDERTFFAGVQRLLPGHYLLRRGDGDVSVHRYWQLAWNPDFSGPDTDEQYAERFAELWERVIRRHLIADVPLGCNLSGGLDSSGVVSTAAGLVRSGVDAHTGGRLHTFSALFPNETIDESRYIHEVERYAGTVPTYSYPKPDEFWAEIDDWVWTQEEPTISSAPYAYYSVFRTAAQHVKVSLSGNGGDELLAGYLPYLRTYLYSALDSGHYSAAALETLRGVPVFYRQYLERAGQAVRGQYRSVDFLLGQTLRRYRGLTFGYSRNLNERLGQDVTKYSTPNLLRYEDKNSMAFGLESRVPFLDSELVEFVFSLPIDQKIKHGWTRYVYRNALRGRMPELNRRRRSKIGFTNPEVGWLHVNADGIRKVFAGSELAAHRLFDQDELVASFDRWLAGKERVKALTYWRVLISELWIRRFELEVA